jgi:hypothetical protein
MNTVETISGEDFGAADPLALDPLSPIAVRPARFAATLAPAEPLALDPLGAVVPLPDDR